METLVSGLARCSSRALAPIDQKWLRDRIREEVEELANLLNLEPLRAKAKLREHVTEIRMTPSEAEGKTFYIADGEWDMLQTQPGGSTLGGAEGLHFRMVAGVG